MAQELQIDPATSTNVIIFFSFIALFILIVLILEIIFFKKKKYALAIGGIAGLILAIANGLSLGILGFIFWFPFSSFCSGGESCWGPIVYVGSTGFLISGFLIGWVFEKIKSRKQE